MQMALDTANGMHHLTAGKFVHRDLAARNVLVDAVQNCKVADFGLARGIAGARVGSGTIEDGEEEEYYRSRTGTFPVRWTSPEAMQTMRFSEATDVWSFGITMLEGFTDGAKPYSGMTNAAVISQVQGGYRAEQPTLCPDEVYAIMLECWATKAANRPTFAQLVAKLEGVESLASTSSGAVPAKARLAASSRQAVAVNDTYMADGPAPAEEMAGQCLTVDNAGSADGDAEADNEYLSVAAGLSTTSAHDYAEDSDSIDL